MPTCTQHGATCHVPGKAYLFFDGLGTGSHGEETTGELAAYIVRHRQNPRSSPMRLCAYPFSKVNGRATWAFPPCGL